MRLGDPERHWNKECNVYSRSIKKTVDEDVNAVSHNLRVELFLIDLQLYAIPQANVHFKNFFGGQISHVC